MSDQFDTTRAPQIGGAYVGSDDAPQLGGDAALKHIVVMMQSEDKEIRQQAIDQLEAIGSERALDLLLDALKDKNRRVRDRALLSIGYLGNRRAFDTLIALLDSRETAEDERYDHETEEIELYQADWPSRIDMLETIGRLGDPRGLRFFTFEACNKNWSFRLPISFSWAIASIAAKNPDFETQQQAARQFIRLFSKDDKYIVNRLPWHREQILSAVASLLSEPENCLYAASFLASFGDDRGREVLLAALYDDSELTQDLAQTKSFALHSLIELGDRRALAYLIKVLDAPFPPDYAVRALDNALDKWGDSLSNFERKQLTNSVPYLINYVKIDGVNPHVVKAIRMIGSELATDLLDEFLGEEIYRTFEAYIERGDTSYSYKKNDLFLISRGFHYPNSAMLSHPLLRRYGFNALRAYYDGLRAQDPPVTDGLLVANIGWLGDPQALDWLVQELAREEQEVLTRREDPDNYRDRGEVGEFIYAIANLRIPESVPILVERLLNRDSLEWWDTNKALRFYINDVPDERVVMAQLKINTPGSEWIDEEVLEAIGRTGLACAVPGLSRLLVRRDDGCSEAINALAEIAKRNPTNTELIDQIVAHLIPMLEVRAWVGMNCYYQPWETMRIDHFTAIVLKDIGTREGLEAVARWEKGARHD